MVITNDCYPRAVISTILQSLQPFYKDRVGFSFTNIAYYSYKCGVPKKQLRQDMKKAFAELQKVEHVNPLTEDDIRLSLIHI